MKYRFLLGENEVANKVVQAILFSDLEEGQRVLEFIVEHQDDNIPPEVVAKLRGKGEPKE